MIPANLVTLNANISSQVSAENLVDLSALIAQTPQELQKVLSQQLGSWQMTQKLLRTWFSLAGYDSCLDSRYAVVGQNMRQSRENLADSSSTNLSLQLDYYGKVLVTISQYQAAANGGLPSINIKVFPLNFQTSLQEWEFWQGLWIQRNNTNDLENNSLTNWQLKLA